MNYYPFHIGDYVSATRHLSWEEDCAYRRLLDTYYTTEKPLPEDAKSVCRLVLATTEAQREAVSTVLEEFFERTPDGWVNRRADAEIAAMKERQQKQRDKANAMWEKRRAATGTSHPPEHGKASAMPQHPPNDATASKSDADAMPPTPTPTPTPTLPGVEGGTPPKPPPFALPDWIPADAWQEFVEMRRAKGKRAPFTLAAAKGIVADLEKLRAQGNEVGSVLRQSVTNGWSGVFALKNEQPARGRPAGSDWTGSAT